MTWNRNVIVDRGQKRARMFAGLLMGAMLSALCAGAQAQSADAKPAESKPADTRSLGDSTETLYLHNATQQNDLNDIQTALRNMLPKAKIYGTPSQNSITLRANAEDMQLAHKIV